MTLENKKELVRLLHLYMADIMRQDSVEKRNRSLAMHVGIKSQFDHARIIVNKLERELSTGLFTNG
jgi:hypothetical protein